MAATTCFPLISVKGKFLSSHVYNLGTGERPWWRCKMLRLVLAGLCSMELQIQSRPALAVMNCENENSYEAVRSLTGNALMQTLHGIVQEHDAISYVKVWEALKVLDQDPDFPDNIIEIYSQRSVPKQSSGKLDGWNREHLWPRSYGLKQGRPEFTDLHNLRPADSNVNSSRGNKYFGDCKLESEGDCLVPANREAGADTAADRKKWRPPEEVRGDIARSLMYMVVRYFPSLGLSDTPSITKAEMGLLSILLRWNEVDPPSPSERIRNSKVCALFQHNKNPFVDHPEFARRIWETNSNMK